MFARFLRIATAVCRQTSVVGATLLMGLAAPAAAQMTQADGAVVIGNDRGGFVRQRLIDIRNLRESGQRVQIRGDICYSTCTMLIGLPNACISPRTVFGFHGPSRFGLPLTAAEFDFTSRVMANHYPAPLRDWFLREGRNRINGIYRISGEQLIALGVEPC